MKYTVSNRYRHSRRRRSSHATGKFGSTLRFHTVRNENALDDSLVFEGDESERSQDSVSEMFFIGQTKRRTKYNKNKLRIQSASMDDVSANFPPDCYSFISLHGPSEKLFWIGLMVFCFQIAFLACALLSITNSRWRTGKVDDNPWDGVFSGLFATEVGPILRATQFMSLVTSVIFVDSSVNDIITAVYTFPNFALAIPGRDKVWCMVLSCFLRFIQGLFALLVSIVLVFHSNNVIDVILNFTALNFISALDDLFFDFSKSGKYGPYLEDAANRIEHERLPVCMFRKYKHVRPFYTFIPLSIIVILFTCWVVVLQEHPTRWETHVVRVQFDDDAGLQKFNGCYNNDFERDDGPWKRDFYVHDENFESGNTAEFGFCIDDERWILYEGNEPDPCKVDNDDILIFSSPTDSFDIHTSFLNDWFSSKGIPADLYFFDEIQDAEQLYCNEFINDGICNVHFNDESFDFDGGDCCAATCSHEGCGVGALPNPFNSTNRTGFGYPHCNDPNMMPLVIELNAFTNNRDLYKTTVPLSGSERSHIETFRPDFWDVEPADALLTLYCNGIKILKVYINPSMIDQTEMVMVPEEAKCEIRIKNSTATVTHFDDDPLWYVNYTVYNHKIDNLLFPPVILVQESSFVRQSVSFERIPVCYADKIFGEQRNVMELQKSYNMYNNLSATEEAVQWMVNVTETKNGVCPGYFGQRFALASMFYTAPSAEPWIYEDAPCNWPNIICVGEYNSSDPTLDLDLINLDLAEVGLSGSIANEIALLENLALYDVSDNLNLTGTIPTVIGYLKSLTELKLENNTLYGPIPSEIGLLTSLTRLHLTSNDWTGTIPSEIGMLTNLASLRILNGRQLTGTIPSEIGSLTSLTSLRIGRNPGLTSTIPSEVQYLTNLKLLTFRNNTLTGNIPSEIGLLTSLTRLRFGKKLIGLGSILARLQWISFSSQNPVIPPLFQTQIH